MLSDHEKEMDVDAIAAKVLTERFDHTAPMPPEPPYLIYIGGKGIALPGSLVQVSGQSKSRKSSLMAMMAASCLSKDGNYENKIISNVKGKILWFDTEQSDYEVQMFQNHVVGMSGVTNDDEYIRDKYYAMKLRPYDEVERLRVVDRLITAPDVFDDVGIIFLDGVADLLYNVNEIEASKKLVTRLTYWADLLEVPLVTAIHTNKDGKDSTGSLGGFMNKKCSYHIRAEKEYEDGPTTIMTYLSRNGQSFQKFAITNGLNGRPEIHDVIDLTTASPDKSSRSQRKETPEVKKDPLDVPTYDNTNLMNV